MSRLIHAIAFHGSRKRHGQTLHRDIAKISQEIVHAVAPPKAAAGAPDIDSIAFIKRQPANSIAPGFVPIFHSVAGSA